MNFFRFNFFVFFFILVSCAPADLTRIAALSLQPYVLSVTPEEGSEISDIELVDLYFSRPLLVSTISQDTVFIVSREIYETYPEDEWDGLADDVRDGTVDVIAGDITLSDDATHVYYAPTEEFPVTGEYLIVALPMITTPDYYPLDQTVVGEVTRQFQSSFLVSVSQSAITPDEIVDTVETSVNESVGVEVAQSEIAPEFDFNRVLISEVVTDPQQDHAESSGGNGIIFDPIAGSGSIGTTDEYVEIYNGTSESVDLRGWQLTMIDGTDVTQALDDSSWSLFFSDGGTVENFISGEVLVLGNPKGDLKNTIGLDLTDLSGGVVDSIDIEDANATNLEDEAYELDDAGLWEMDEASPGEVEF